MIIYSFPEELPITVVLVSLLYCKKAKKYVYVLPVDFEIAASKTEKILFYFWNVLDLKTARGLLTHSMK